MSTTSYTHEHGVCVVLSVYGEQHTRRYAGTMQYERGQSFNLVLLVCCAASPAYVFHSTYELVYNCIYVYCNRTYNNSFFEYSVARDAQGARFCISRTLYGRTVLNHRTDRFYDALTWNRSVYARTCFSSFVLSYVSNILYVHLNMLGNNCGALPRLLTNQPASPPTSVM